MAQVGDTAETRMTVTKDDTAAAIGSGTLEVLATPRMALMVEATAMKAIEGRIPEGDTTVGTLLDLKHVSPSPVGSEVVCRCTVVEVDRARIRFEVSVTDAFGDVGTGFHERFVVHPGKFMQKAAGKLQRASRSFFQRRFAARERSRAAGGLPFSGSEPRGWR